MAEQTLVKEKPVAEAAEAVVTAETNGVTDTEKALQAETNGVADTEKALQAAKKKLIEVVIDLDGLLIGDLEVLDRAKDGNLPMKELVAFLDRVVVDGVKHLPMRYFSTIVDQLGDAIAESANPGN